jgi:hypothetical protein
MKSKKIINKIDPIAIPNVCFSVCRNNKDFSKKHLEQFRRQRVKRGFDETELWDLSWGLMEFLLPRLKAFKKMKRHGISPMDVYDKFNGKNKDEKASKEWEKILDEIIWSIEQELFWDKSEEYKICKKYPYEKRYKTIKESDDLYGDKLIDKKMQRAYEKEMYPLEQRKEKGLNLLKKYLFDLWD